MSASIEDQLADLRSRSLLRRLRTFDTPQQPEMTEAGKSLVSFASNDYLGLATEPALKEAAKAAIDRYGVGSGAARLLSGSLPPHADLENAIARFKGTEAALAFSSGYATALGTLGALCGPEDVIILDKLSHASLIDGARLSRATVRVFPHNHLGRLESHLTVGSAKSSGCARDHRNGGRIQHGWRSSAPSGNRGAQKSFRRMAACR